MLLNFIFRITVFFLKITILFEKNLDSFNKYPGALFETSEFIKYKIENRIKKILQNIKRKIWNC